jgi:hypothetical protein
VSGLHTHTLCISSDYSRLGQPFLSSTIFTSIIILLFLLCFLALVAFLIDHKPSTFFFFCVLNYPTLNKETVFNSISSQRVKFSCYLWNQSCVLDSSLLNSSSTQKRLLSNCQTRIRVSLEAVCLSIISEKGMVLVPFLVLCSISLFFLFLEAVWIVHVHFGSREKLGLGLIWID